MRTVERPVRRDQVIAQSTGGETVLLDVPGGEYFTLNEVGSRVWELCDGTHTVANVVACIIDEYEAPRDVVEADVGRLVLELASAGLVEWHR